MTKKPKKHDRYAIIDKDGKIKDTFRSKSTAINMMAELNNYPKEELEIVNLEDLEWKYMNVQVVIIMWLQ